MGIAMSSLIEQFNESVKYYDAQTEAEWQHSAIQTLSKKFTRLAKCTENDAELGELINGMTTFMARYINADYDDGDPGYEEVDAATESIGQMGDALIGAAKPGTFPAGSAKPFNLLAAKLIGLAEEANDTDTDKAYQDQADKVSEIADAIQRMEAAPMALDKDIAASKKLSLNL